MFEIKISLLNKKENFLLVPSTANVHDLLNRHENEEEEEDEGEGEEDQIEKVVFEEPRSPGSAVNPPQNGKSTHPTHPKPT